MKKNIADKIPIEDTTPAIMHSAKVLVRTTGTGASLGTSPPNIQFHWCDYTVDIAGHLAI